jgi:hypothetical protein
LSHLITPVLGKPLLVDLGSSLVFGAHHRRKRDSLMAHPDLLRYNQVQRFSPNSDRVVAHEAASALRELRCFCDVGVHQLLSAETSAPCTKALARSAVGRFLEDEGRLIHAERLVPLQELRRRDVELLDRLRRADQQEGGDNDAPRRRDAEEHPAAERIRGFLAKYGASLAAGELLEADDV